MKKIFAILLAVMLIASMTVSANAVTPKLDLDLPEIPDISGSVKVEVSRAFADNWIKAHPFKVDFSKFEWRWN